uniref:Uncharacterized protein n=1 Tax=Rhizophora mucronata TaxID=61149 RepID=A0A2P2PRN2_RHIMU
MYLSLTLSHPVHWMRLTDSSLKLHLAFQESMISWI